MSLATRGPDVLRTYYEEYPHTFLSQHHKESYEAFVFRELLDILQASNPITILKEPIGTDGKYKYRTEIYIGGKKDKAEDLRIAIAPPTVTLDSGMTRRRMTPNEARLRGQTYAATFMTDLHIVLTFLSEQEPGKFVETKREIKFEGEGAFPLFNLPILLRSKLCLTHEADAQLLYELGECRNDQGGYFVVDGAEKVLIARQEQAFNSIFAVPRPKTDLEMASYSSVVCQDPKSKQTRRITLVRFHANSSREEGVLRISIPFVKGNIPVFALFRAMGVESDEEIVRLIVPDTASASAAAMEQSLIPSIQDAWPIATKSHAIEFIRTLTKGFMVEHVLDIIQNNLFTHVPYDARPQYLAEMVRKLIRVEMNLELPTYRDDIRNQRLLSTGALIRDLFAEGWKVWKKAVILYVDKEYDSNKTLYADENFLNIFSPANIGKVMSSDAFQDVIMRGFRGKWGTNQYNMKAGVVQPLARISYLDAMSHVRRVVLEFDTSLKSTGPRHLHPSQIGYFCTSETPTGGHIGVSKNLSMMTAISVVMPTTELMAWLYKRGGVIPVQLATPVEKVMATSVQINGGTIGFTTVPGQLTAVLKVMKWTACIAPTASISFNTADNTLRIYCDDGRPIRPLWHLNHGKIPEQASKKPLPSWRDLVCGTLPLTKDAHPHSVDFVDPLASKESPTLADYIEALVKYVGAVEYVDPYEGNEAYISWWGGEDLTPEHTHCELHPSTITGLLTSMIPFANHNQSPRNQLSCSQSKQAIGYYATNYESRFDTYGSMLCYGEGPLARTITYDTVAKGEMPYGTNVIFAINSFNGYNQDDGILFNRNSIQRGLFRSLALRSYTAKEEEDSMNRVLTRIGNPRNVMAWTDLKPGRDYSGLDEHGVIKEGTMIHDKMVLVGMYSMGLDSGRIYDSSILPTIFTKGRVDKVAVLHQANGFRMVHVRIIEERIPELGDKFSSRHGQKGTMGMLLDAQDMPVTADGIVPDVMVNPHCIPSRMTIAQLLEQEYGKLGAHIGAKMNATLFMNNEDSFNAVADALEETGFQRDGEEIMYSGITGKQFASSIFIGPLYYMRLKHLTQDKLNARSEGRKEMLTHQPTGGRGNEGGMRVGDMERDSLIAHGVSEFLQESFMKRSDGTEFWVCNGCGNIPITNEQTGLFLCPTCDGPIHDQFLGNTADTLTLVLPVRQSRATFSKVAMPYVLKLLGQEIDRGNYQMRFLTAEVPRAFREQNTVKERPAPPPPSPLANVITTTVEPVKTKKTKRKVPSTAGLSSSASSSSGLTASQSQQDMALLSRPSNEQQMAQQQLQQQQQQQQQGAPTVNIVLNTNGSESQQSQQQQSQQSQQQSQSQQQQAAEAPRPPVEPDAPQEAPRSMIGTLTSAIANAPRTVIDALNSPVNPSTASEPTLDLRDAVQAPKPSMSLAPPPDQRIITGSGAPVARGDESDVKVVRVSGM